MMQRGFSEGVRPRVSYFPYWASCSPMPPYSQSVSHGCDGARRAARGQLVAHVARAATENHAEVTRSGTGHLILEKELARLGVERRVVLQVPSFLSLEYVLEDSNLLVMLPKYLGSLFESRGRIRTFALPFELHEYAVKLHWHERFHRDPGAVWMRKTLRDLCLHTIKDLNK
jgi:DNA-binding transcriptional LysR family regulator